MASKRNEQNPQYEGPAQEAFPAIVHIDPYRPPQLNGDNISSGCNCPCARGGSEGGEDMVVVDSDQDAIIHGPLNAVEHTGMDASTLFIGDDAGGDEGAEKHLEDGEWSNSPASSPEEVVLLDSSMFVEHGSRTISLESSLATLPSRNSSVFALCGGWADAVFISAPLILTHEVPHCYPRELVMS